MSRFFKSAAFPILIVVVLAFFAQKLISPGTQTRQNTYADFVNQLQDGQVAKAVVKTKDNTIQVQLKAPEKTKYEVGFTDAAGKEVTDQLVAAQRSVPSESRVQRMSHASSQRPASANSARPVQLAGSSAQKRFTWAAFSTSRPRQA